MLLTLPLHLILATCVVARSVPRILPPWSDGPNVATLPYPICSLDDCNYLACTESTAGPVDPDDCSYIANLTETNGDDIIVHPKSKPWSYKWNSCEASITTRIWYDISVCPQMFSKLWRNATIGCNGGLAICASMFSDGRPRWTIGFYRS